MCFDNSGQSFDNIEAYFVWANKQTCHSYSGLSLSYSAEF